MALLSFSREESEKLDSSFLLLATSQGKVKRAALELGLMCYPMGGTIDGARGDHVLLAPPFIITDDEMDVLIERLVEAVDTAIGAGR